MKDLSDKEKLLVIEVLLVNKSSELNFSDHEIDKIFGFNVGDIFLEYYLRELEKMKYISLEVYSDDGLGTKFFVEVKEYKGLFKEIEVIFEEKNICLQQKNDEIIKLKNKLEEIITFNPDNIDKDLEHAKETIEGIKNSINSNEMLKSLLPTIEIMDKYLGSVSKVHGVYEDVLKNIIKPLQKEGESGVKATVKWAIISIIVSTIISIVLNIITAYL